MGKYLNILIVEDEYISRVLLKEMLAPFGDCKMVTNGKEAVAVLHESYNDSKKRFDLVCLDIMMPEMDGHQVLRELRKIEKEKGLKSIEMTKVVMISALDDTENIIEAIVVGRCQAYLTKPVNKGRLEEQLQDLRLIEKTSSA